MGDDKPHLTIVGSDYISDHDLEFEPLPYYPWAERPLTASLTIEECATALHLSHGDKRAAAGLLKVPWIRVERLIRGSPRLQRVQDESEGEVRARARSVIIQTLFDDGADARRLEWAATKVMQSRLGMGDSLSPSPASTVQSSVTLADQGVAKEIVFRWKAPLTGGEDPPTLIDDERSDG